MEQIWLKRCKEQVQEMVHYLAQELELNQALVERYLHSVCAV
jgi:hypothetical protein